MRTPEASNIDNFADETEAGAPKHCQIQAVAERPELPGWPLARLDEILGDVSVRTIAIDVETRLDRDAALAQGFDPDGKAPMPPCLFQVQAVTVFVSHHASEDAVLPYDFDLRSYTQEQFAERDLIAVLIAEITRAHIWYGFAWERHEMPVLLARGTVHDLDLSTFLVPRKGPEELAVFLRDTTQLVDLCAGMNIPTVHLGGVPAMGRSLEGEARATALWLLSTFTYGRSMLASEHCWSLLADWIDRQPGFAHLKPFVGVSPLPEEPPAPALQA
jgi:hypothetical protein